MFRLYDRYALKITKPFKKFNLYASWVWWCLGWPQGKGWGRIVPKSSPPRLNHGYYWFKPYYALHKSYDEAIWFCSHFLILLIEIHMKPRRYSSLYLFEKKRTLFGAGWGRRNGWGYHEGSVLNEGRTAMGRAN